MDKKRITILLGAGFAREWGGPSSEEIKNIVLSHQVKCKDGRTICEFFQDLLTTDTIKKEDINFEAILNVFDLLMQFYNEKHEIFGNYQPSFQSSIFREKEILENFKNFTLSHQNNNLFSINYHNGIMEETLYGSDKLSPEKIFLKNVYIRIIERINAVLSNYVLKYTIDKKSELNNTFKKFISYLSQKYIVRIYTLNYDRLIPLILQDNNLFDGFDIQVNDDLFAPNLKKIITDFNCLNYFNLHGSLFWEVLPSNNFHEYKFWSHKKFPHFINDTDAEIATNPSEIILPVNIITGYQKTQRIMMSPLKQFSFAFEYDCQHSDIILPIGYSFSDNHINLTIKDAIEANNKIKLLNVTYCQGKYFTNGNKELSRIELYILKLNNQFRDNKFKLTDEEIISSTGNQIMYFKGAGTFLKNNLWEKYI